MKQDKADIYRPKENTISLSASQLLARVIDPNIDIRPIFKQYYSQYDHIYDKKLTAEQKDYLTTNSANYTVENMIKNSIVIDDLRDRATKILEKDPIFVESHYQKTALKLHKQMVDYSLKYLSQRSGESHRANFNDSPDSVINIIRSLVESQTKFLHTIRDKKDSAKVEVFVPTHNPNDDKGYLDRVDSGQVTLGITPAGKINSLGITELFAYTAFSDTQVSIVDLAKNIPDDLANKFNFFGDMYSTGELSNTKIKITGRLHDYGENQFWINCAPKPGTNNDDCYNLVKLWLQTLHDQPRIPKAQKSEK